MEQLTIVIQDGEVKMLHCEDIDLTEIGHVTTERASTVEFDEARQLWVVRDTDGREMHASKSRAECLRYEREYFNTMLRVLAGV